MSSGLIIKHHPKLLKHWAKNYVDWCFNPSIGSKAAKNRMEFLFTAETILTLREPIVEEFKKRGNNVT